MAELPSGLLEACVVVGAHSDKLRDIHQVCMQTDSLSIKVSQKTDKKCDHAVEAKTGTQRIKTKNRTYFWAIWILPANKSSFRYLWIVTLEGADFCFYVGQPLNHNSCEHLCPQHEEHDSFQVELGALWTVWLIKSLMYRNNIMYAIMLLNQSYLLISKSLQP